MPKTRAWRDSDAAPPAPLRITPVSLEKLRGRLLISLALGALVFAGLSAYADFGSVVDGLGSFDWRYLPAVLALTSLNYALRFLKWQFYLRAIGVTGLPAGKSALTYYAGLGMVVTPGKVGEWLKCYLLRELHGTPFSRSAPIIIAERLTDSLALVLLGGAGLLVYGDAWPAFVVIVLGSAFLFVLVRHRRLARWLLARMEGLPLISGFAGHAHAFYESSYAILSPSALISMTLLSVVSWSFEVFGFYLVLMGLGVEGGWDVLLKAGFIMSAATLASALLLTPGGLGVAEGGITGLSQLLLELEKGPAAVGAIVIRLGTLWFGVLVGLVALAIVTRELTGRDRQDEAVAAPSADVGPP
jgi:uncharacterized protein (TIRG00374 family)